MLSKLRPVSSSDYILPMCIICIYLSTDEKQWPTFQPLYLIYCSLNEIKFIKGLKELARPKNKNIYIFLNL